MSKTKDANEFQQMTAKQRKVMRVPLLSCQLVGFQKSLELVTRQLAFSQAILAETRDQLEAAHQALVQVVAET